MPIVHELNVISIMLPILRILKLDVINVTSENYFHKNRTYCLTEILWHFKKHEQFMGEKKNEN